MRNFLSRNLNTHVTSCYHDTVCYCNDLIQVFNTFCILDLSDYLDCRTFCIQHFLDLTDTVSCTYKRSCDKIKALFDTKTDIFFIFFSQCRKFDLYVRNIYTLLLA